MAHGGRKVEKPAVDLKQKNAALKRDLRGRTAELARRDLALRQSEDGLREALQQQTATADVLRLISRSTVDLPAVLQTVAETAGRLCDAGCAYILRRAGDVYRIATAVAFSPQLKEGTREFQAYLQQHPLIPGRGSITGRVALGGRAVHVVDTASDPEYALSEATTLGKLHTQLGVPLLRDGDVIGVIVLSRSQVEPFTEKQIELVTTFADQAAIAIENTRLLTEQREALERQTATAEVLRVINSSPADLAPVFTAMLDNATRLCEATFGNLWLYDGQSFELGAAHGPSPFRDVEALRRAGRLAGPHTAMHRVVKSKQTLEIADYRTERAYLEKDPVAVAAVDFGNIRSVLAVPLLAENKAIGVFFIYRQEVRPFTEKQIELVTSFANQAVIAIENVRLLNEQREALERQTATAEVLQVINSSPGELAPVFATMLEKATRLCGAGFGVLWIYEGERFSATATHAVPPAFAEFCRGPVSVAGSASLKELVRGGSVVHVPDLAATELYHAGNPIRRAVVDLGGARTLLSVPLRKDDALLGAFTIYRKEVRPFSDKEIALVQNFAAQAVIAMENARLLEEVRHRNDELAEALEFQTATGEVLRIVASSPDNLQSVFDAMLEKATELCEAKFGSLFLYDGKAFTVAAGRNLPVTYAQAVRGQSFSPETNVGFRRLVESKAPVHVKDVFADPAYVEREPLRVAAVELGGVRSFVAVPMLKKGELIGNFSIYRDEPGGFAENQIALVTTFADQAVIAIENARLFDELRDRQTELARSVDELTATGDVLKIISRSSVDLETVLDTLVETVARLCHADHAVMFRRRDDMYQLVAARGLSPEAKEFFVAHPSTPGRGATVGRVELERRVVHITDVLQDPEYTYTGAQKLTGARTMLGIPLLREHTLVGIFVVVRTRVEAFTTKEIELATSFADQAVIAIENARLFEELRERQAELRVTFDNMGDGVVMFDAGARLTAWNRNFQEILDLPDAFLAGRPSHAEYFQYLADRGEYLSADLEQQLSRAVEDTRQELRFERTRPDGHVIEVRRNPVPGGGFVMIYSDITERKRAEEAIRAARDAAEAALRDLQTAQASLLHSQKMAALGQLTAGIAHEIKNPLNFVNNFAGLSAELLDELKEATTAAMGPLGSEVAETIEMLTGNLEKIAEHGRRADGIVKSMLAHSRGGSGDWQAADLNVLLEEALNLAYHGARAQDQSFNITMERDLDRDLAPVDIVPQDVTRVFLNLIGNGFYAANKRKREAEPAFRPVLQVATRDLGDAVEIRVRDNGIGIAPEHRDRLFQPFFTTKPTGEGTGLGLSISYDIVTQQHGGTIAVDSEVGAYTEFTVRLPRRPRVAAAG